MRNVLGNEKGNGNVKQNPLSGTVIGALATVAYVTYQGWPPVIPLSAIAMGTGGAMAIGVLAGMYPSVRAARLAPTEALSTG